MWPFNLLSDKSKTPTISDVDGNVYHTVKIGTQEWTVENFRTTKYNDGSPITLTWNDRDPAYCYYDHKDRNKRKYGFLYNLPAVREQKLPITGWHVSTTADWNTLEQHLSTTYCMSTTGNSLNNKVAKLLMKKGEWKTKEKSTSEGFNKKLFNKSMFSAMPGGFRNGDGLFLGIKYDGFWWEMNGFDGYIRHLCMHDDELKSTTFGDRCWHSVRLVKNV